MNTADVLIGEIQAVLKDYEPLDRRLVEAVNTYMENTPKEERVDWYNLVMRNGSESTFQSFDLEWAAKQLKLGLKDELKKVGIG